MVKLRIEFLFLRLKWRIKSFGFSPNVKSKQSFRFRSIPGTKYYNKDTSNATIIQST